MVFNEMCSMCMSVYFGWLYKFGKCHLRVIIFSGWYSNGVVYLFILVTTILGGLLFRILDGFNCAIDEKLCTLNMCFSARHGNEPWVELTLHYIQAPKEPTQT